MTDHGARSAVRADTRRRVLAAFVTQDPSEGGPPAPRTRPLVAGVVVAVLLLMGGVVSGRLTGSSAGGWLDGDVIVGRPSAARLVSIQGVLHPLLNTASGRLLVPASSLAASSRTPVVVVDDAALTGVRRGAPLGIPDAPDVLPTPSALVQTGWLACLDGTRVRTRIAASSPATVGPASEEHAVVVVVGGRPGEIDLVAGTHRFRIAPGSYPAVKQYLDQMRPPLSAPSGWVDLFPSGTDLTFASFRFAAPATVGRPMSGAIGPRGTISIGQLVTNSDRAQAPLVVVADGTIALTPFAAAIYRATAPPTLATPFPVTDADLARLPPSPTVNFTPPDWPTTPPRAWPGSASTTACAELDAAVGRPPTTHVRFADRTEAASEPNPTAPLVDTGGGAVVEVVTGPDRAADDYLVDPSGRAFPLGGSPADTLARLGYADVVPSVVSPAWIALCPKGPALSAAAMQFPLGGSTSS